MKALQHLGRKRKNLPIWLKNTISSKSICQRRTTSGLFPAEYRDQVQGGPDDKARLKGNKALLEHWDKNKRRPMSQPSVQYHPRQRIC
jgi:hypothetical protein